MKRYVVELDFFVFGKTEEEAIKMAADIKNKIKQEHDNTPQITKIYRQDFGKTAGEELDIFKPPICNVISGA
jgi:hypothetical protein